MIRFDMHVVCGSRPYHFLKWKRGYVPPPPFNFTNCCHYPQVIPSALCSKKPRTIIVFPFVSIVHVNYTPKGMCRCRRLGNSRLNPRVKLEETRETPERLFPKPNLVPFCRSNPVHSYLNPKASSYRQMEWDSRFRCIET